MNFMLFYNHNKNHTKICKFWNLTCIILAFELKYAWTGYMLKVSVNASQKGVIPLVPLALFR